MNIKEEILENPVKLSFIISDESKKFITQLVYTKIVRGHLKFCLTDAIIESVASLQKKNPNIPQRKNITRRFNKRGASKTPVKGLKTSILVPVVVFEWIENYICYRIERDILYTRTLFINDLINLLKKKYKDKLLVVPEV